MNKRVLSYDLLPSKTNVSWEDVKRAALDNKLSPFTPSEKMELLLLENDDDAFYKRMWEMLRNEPNE